MRMTRIASVNGEAQVPKIDTPRVAQRGFTLLEVLIALVVLSIGLLGLAALQARAMRFNHDSFVRSDATALANDIMDRIRASAYNLTGAQAEDTIEAYTGAAGACNDTDPAPAISAAADLGCWLAMIRRDLPGGAAASGTIARVPGVGADNGDPSDDVYEVAIQWIDRETGAPVTQFFAFQP